MAGFDFNAAAAAAQRDYPEETQHTAFININARGGRVSLREFAKKYYMQEEGVSEAETHTLAAKLKIRMSAMRMSRYTRKSQGALTFYINREVNALLVRTGRLKSLIKAPFIQLQFSHELGHIVVPNGHSSKCTNHENERAADCFAAMRMLTQEEFGLGDILQFASFRANGWSSVHNTSAALKTLAEDLKGMKKKTLTPQEIKAKANAYGPKPS